MKTSIRWTSITLYAFMLSTLIIACNPNGQSLEGDLSFSTDAPLTPTSIIKPTELPLTISATATTISIPTASPTDAAAQPKSSLIENNKSNLHQVSSIPDSTIYWTSKDILRVYLDSIWDRETRCTTNPWQEFSVKQYENRIEIIPSTGETVRCPEPKPSLPDALSSALPGIVVDQTDSSERAYSLLLVEVLTSTLPMIGNADGSHSENDLPVLEGWVIDHETDILQPIFATQLNYGYGFLPGNRHLVITQACYGNDLGEGLHVANIVDSSILTLVETYSGRCEGSLGLMPSPDGQYLIHSKGIVVNVHDGETVSKLCAEGQYPRSWAWSVDSKRVYVACNESEYDLLWQYDIETGNKLLLNDLINPPVSIKARQMAVSPDEKWLAFVWGTSELFSLDEYGVWILELKDDS